jgi:hypothetical protein
VSSRLEVRFLLALHEHYGPDLPFSAAAVMNKPQLRALAPVSEPKLDAWFGERAGQDLSGIIVLPAIGHRDGQDRKLWRVTVSSSNSEAVEAGRTRCRAVNCEVEFTPARRDQVFCSRACKERARQARKRGSDPCGSGQEGRGRSRAASAPSLGKRGTAMRVSGAGS